MREEAMPHRPRYEPIPEGVRSLAELVMHLNDDEWQQLRDSLAATIRLAARAVGQYDMSRQLP